MSTEHEIIDNIKKNIQISLKICIGASANLKEASQRLVLEYKKNIDFF